MHTTLVEYLLSYAYIIQAGYPMHNAQTTYLVFSFTAPERREVKPGGEKQILPPLISIPCSVPRSVPLSHCPMPNAQYHARTARTEYMHNTYRTLQNTTSMHNN